MKIQFEKNLQTKILARQITLVFGMKPSPLPPASPLYAIDCVCYRKEEQIKQVQTELDQEKRMADNLVNDMVGQTWHGGP